MALAFAQPSNAPRGLGADRPKRETVPDKQKRELDSDRTKRGGGDIALAPNQPDPPSGFDTPHAGIARGKITPFEYESKAGGGTFCATIHTPPGFSPSEKYPVLYLLHGASGDENTWVREIRAGRILDNLYAAKKIAPMLVVMPSSLSVAARGRAGGNRDAMQRSGMAFGEVLLRDLVPFVESNYPAISNREHRALAGLSMGAGLALNTGLLNPDKFAWLGAFSGGSARRLAGGQRFDVSSPGRQPQLLWLSVGNRDTLMAGGAAALDAFLTERKIPHLFRVNDGAHEPNVWAGDLYHFAQLLFRDAEDATGRAGSNCD